ncbi:Gfo/Idh/MocA family protein [Sphingobacterium spiritivorum]|uniref:Gfo/Idh/MocA family protein n=1 Tax=Sphingobacterium spiritivorum TaxID=258 RepID=UPI003DA4C933
MNTSGRREFIRTGSAVLGAMMIHQLLSATAVKGKRIGIIGLDTSHAVAFTKAINTNPAAYRDYHVVAAYPYGTKTIPSATDRIPKYIEEVKSHGVAIVNSIAELLKKVDAVLLETNDGRLHLEQATQIFKAGKPVFIDKPIAASYADAYRIMKLSRQYNTPMFSTSSLRYIGGMEEISGGRYGKVLAVDVFTPATLESTHPDFFWYGIHGVEMLFAAMGTGCKSVSRVHTTDSDLIVGVWEGGRIGTVRGMRIGKNDFGGIIFCEQENVKLGEFKGYEPLLHKIVDFFDSGEPPVDGAQTLEICAFIEAADISKNNNGKAVELSGISAVSE